MPVAVIFTGIQACGKTSYYHKYFEDYAHISLDVLNTRNLWPILCLLNPLRLKQTMA